nr:protein NLP4-like isoform X2 [Erigeron canadensis]
MDLRSVVDHQEEEEDMCPLLDFALKSGFTCCLCMPIFNSPSSLSSSCCVGVVECCMKQQSSKGLLLVFNYLKSVLETVGLCTFVVQHFRPYKTICGLNHATNEIEDALDIVCESHHLTYAQVWISYEDKNHVLFSSDTPRKQMFALKLSGYCVDLDDAHLFSSLMDYHDTCDTLPLKIGQGLSGRTLQVHEPVFYRNISELSDSGPLLLLPANNKCSCLTICLRSTHTGDLVDYAFEFLWPQRRNYLILLESLLLTLKQCLPSFMFSFGAKLGDEVRVVDVENSTVSIIKCFQFFHGIKLSRLSKTLVGRKGLVAKECTSSSELNCKTTSITGVKRKFGSTLEDVEVHGQNRLLKRKSRYLCTSQTELSEKCASSINSETSPCDEILTIKARNKVDDMITFFLPVSSATLAAVKKEIDKGFELSGCYSLWYLDEEEYWNELESDEHLRHSIGSMILANRSHVRLWVRKIIIS